MMYDGGSVQHQHYQHDVQAQHYQQQYQQPPPAGAPPDGRPPSGWGRYSDPPPGSHHGDGPSHPPSWWDRYPEQAQGGPVSYPEQVPGWYGEERYPQSGNSGVPGWHGGDGNSGQMPAALYDDGRSCGYPEAPWYPDDRPPPHSAGWGGPPTLLPEDIGPFAGGTLPPRYSNDLPPWQQPGFHPDADGPWNSPDSPSQASQYSMGRQSYQSGRSPSRRQGFVGLLKKAVPRPPASDDHHRVPKRSQQVRVGGREHPGEAPAEMDVEAGLGSAPPQGPGGDDDRSHVDPSLVMERLGKIRQAQTQKSLSAWAGRGGNDVPPDMKDVPRPPAASQWQVGKTRSKLRHDFNKSELDVAKVIRNYDTDGDWKLELPELKHLLQDHNRWFKQIAPEELDMVMQIADADHDECIEPNELLYALRVWYAYANMPRSVSSVVASLSDASMPTAETFREALLVLNEECPVDMDEAEYVRHVALAIGGTEQRVSAKQIRMAISTWYLHVERKHTTGGELAKHAMSDTHAKILDQNPLQKCCRGERDAVTVVSVCMFLVVWAIIPLLSIVVGMNSNTGEYPCYRPMLSMAVVLTGFGAMSQGIGCLLTTAAWECTSMKACRMSAGMCLGLMTLFLFIFWLIGMWQISMSTPAMCGFMIWEFGNLIWVIVPGFVLIFLCCCLPLLYCFEFCNHRKMDKHLMDAHDPGSDSDDD